MAVGERKRRRGRPRRGGASRDAGGERDVCRLAELCELSPFSLFCALYLGITETDGWAEPSRGRVARRFGLDPGALDAYLAEHGIDLPALERRGFDLEAARLDVQVAPEGISRTELARTLFEELQKEADPPAA